MLRAPSLPGAIAIILLAACASDPDSNAPEINKERGLDYPDTRRGDVVDEYFGEAVADPYRWLEDDRSEETADWVTRQNRVTFDYLAGIAYRADIEARLRTMWNYEKESAPFVEGDFEYFYRNDGLQDQAVVYRRAVGGGEASVFLDPNTFSDDGTVSLSLLSFSRNGRLAAYSVSDGGSDWRRIITIDALTGEALDEPLVDAKFTGISWYGNEGFYYSRYEKPDGSELSAKVDQHLLYYHRLGTSQAEDELVFGGHDSEKYRYVGGYVTEDDRFLAIEGAQSTTGNRLWLIDLAAGDPAPREVQGHDGTDTHLLHSEGETLFLSTNNGAPNGRVVTVAAATPAEANWQDFIPETSEVLWVDTGAGYFFAHYLSDAVSRMVQIDLNGDIVREIPLPGPGTASVLGGKRDASVLYFTFTNYITPSTIFSFAPESGATLVYRASAARFDPEEFESRQVFYTSKDGTRVPMIISHRKGLIMDGSHPTMLYGYGGFDVSLTPDFSITNAVWMSLGGVLAVPNLRGGGEYGRAWHLAGTRLDKQNVFDDFIAAAETLIADGITRPDRLAIRGGSNGGLLVGAAMTQRPDLFQVALPAVGVLDMLRYHKFTAGAGWAFDYGTADDDAEMFAYLKDYSPLHNLVPGTNYPATLVTTGDHDDRVVPAHSFKFAAELQASHAGDAPVLIRIETRAGHGAGTPVSKIIEQYADIFAFTLSNMGYATLPDTN